MYLGRDEKFHPGGMVADKPSYISRFALKFFEILGAGLATAVSGYLVAHLGGYLSWPTQTPAPTAAVEALPGGAKPPERSRGRAVAPAPRDGDAHAVAHDEQGKEVAHATAKAAEVSAPPTSAATATADNDEKRPRDTQPSRKPIADSHPVKPAPHDAAETKAHETIETKAHDEQAVEDQVRAALANVDASHAPAPPSTPLPLAASPAPQTTAASQPPTTPNSPAISATSPGTPGPVAPAALSSPPAQQPLDIQNAGNAAAVTATAPSVSAATPIPVQQPAADPSPLTTVEIKSRPVAGVADASPAAKMQEQASGEPDGNTKGETDKGFFAAIAHLPDMLRSDKHPPSNEPPRPPLPVGE